MSDTSGNDDESPAPRPLQAEPLGLDTLRAWFPEMPEYVLIDFIYKNYAHRPERARELIPYYRNRRYRFGEVFVTRDLFTPETRRRLDERSAGRRIGFRDDARKHAEVRAHLERHGPPREPLILRPRSDGMELVEGWHRTIHGLEMWPEGYSQPAWLEVPKAGTSGRPEGAGE